MKTPSWDFKYHPGFAWCMKRDWYNKVGFFDYAVSGSGDTLSVAAWLKKTFPPGFQSLPKALRREYSKFLNKACPKITCLKGVDVLHLYHGSRDNRQYAIRHKILEVNTDITELIKPNSEGIFEWKHPNLWNPVFFEYFQNRKDDSLSHYVDIDLTS
jgi:hypothetical protein